MSTREWEMVARGVCPDCGFPFAQMLMQQVLAHCKYCGVAWSIEPLKYEPTQREKPNDVPA